jgi:shikimate dehydrogenase
MINQYFKAGVIGWPINHSLSPCLHRFWLKECSIQGEYVPLAISPKNLKSFLENLAGNSWRGINVTLPHKQAAMEFMDHLDPNAMRIGAINTVVVKRDGSLQGINTDGYGFLKSVQSSQPKWSAKTGPTVVLGAGGAARAVLATLVESGAMEIRLVNRNNIKAKKLADEIGGPINVYKWSDRSNVLSEAQLLVNTTSLGMVGQAPLKISLKELPVNAIVNDIVYTPINTDLLRSAQRRGNAIVDGLGMLLHQARFGFSAWFGVEPKVSGALREHVLNEMKS